MSLSILAALLLMSGHGVLQRETIDRIVAVVDNHIITLSDIQAERTMREVLGEPIPRDDTELPDELINQHLIHPQLAQYPGAEPSEDEVEAELQRIIRTKRNLLCECGGGNR